MRETESFYFFWKHQFGQWTMRDMTDPDGITYNCAEQYMMYKKALLFGDVTTAKKILLEKKPLLQQELGREVTGYIEEIWIKNRPGIVWYGNYLKFTQHEDLKTRLLATENKILAEASPYDEIWGIGLAANDELATYPSAWKGQNLLGKTLMSLREFFRTTGI